MQSYSIFWLVFLVLPSTLVAATGYAGAYERLFLWNVYNLLMDDDLGQKVILPFLKQKGDPWRQNKGSGPDNRLLFHEFMERCDNRKRNTCEVNGETSETRSIDDVAHDLNSARYNRVLNIRQLYGLQGYRGHYSDYLQDVNVAVSKARAKGDKGESGSLNTNDYRQWDYTDYISKMQATIKAISDIRTLEFNDKYLKWAFGETFNLYVDESVEPKSARTFIEGVELDDPQTSPYTENKTKYVAVNIENSIKNKPIQAKIQAVLGGKSSELPKKILTWVTYCGQTNNDACNELKLPAFTEESTAHRKVLDAVRLLQKTVMADPVC